MNLGEIIGKDELNLKKFILLKVMKLEKQNSKNHANIAFWHIGKLNELGVPIVATV